MSSMSANERQALRQVVRTRMKVLRADVIARKAELEAGVQQHIAEKYAAADKIVQDLNQVMEGIWDQARKDAHAALEAAQKDHPDLSIKPSSSGIGVQLDNNERVRLRQRLHAEIEARIRNAQTQIDRQEADLIEQITVDGLDSDAAKQFLGRIPTVGDLVPASRLREVTA